MTKESITICSVVAICGSLLIFGTTNLVNFVGGAFLTFWCAAVIWFAAEELIKEAARRR